MRPLFSVPDIMAFIESVGRPFMFKLKANIHSRSGSRYYSSVKKVLALISKTKESCLRNQRSERNQLK